MTSSSIHQKQLFIGQLPDDVTEEQIIEMLSEFGRITKLKLHRDPVTRQTQKCCFVTFNETQSAEDAQRALHNVKLLPGMRYPLQVKFANSAANLNQRKLFIGQISKHLDETGLRKLFSCFGEIEECSVIRERVTENSKGYAFLTFVDKNAANSAINAMHLSRIMEGCSSPIVVKRADSKSMKMLKKLETQVKTTQCNNTPVNNHGWPLIKAEPTSLVTSSHVIWPYKMADTGVSFLYPASRTVHSTLCYLPSVIPVTFTDSFIPNQWTV